MIDKKKIYRLLIILSWVVLVFYLLMKLLFGYTLEIVCNNEKILAICNFVDNNIIANYIVCSIFCWIMFYFYYGAILRKVKLNKKEIIILTITTLISNVFVHFGVLTIVADVIKLFIAPMILLGKFKWKNLLICFIFFVLNLAFQFISMVTSNLSLNSTLQYNMLCSIVLSIDVLIMLVITFLYRKEK